MHQLGQSWHEQELARARRQLQRGESLDAVLEGFSRGLRKKMMHPFLHGLHSPKADERDWAETSLNQLLQASDE